MNLGSYDVAVIGGGHAGVEAALAAARLGVSTVLFTISLDAIGNLPCNPSIGGTAKGHLVREIDALGGQMGLAADATMLQSRMLNRGKGPAVHSLRMQTDRVKYHLYIKKVLENTKNLEIKQAEVVSVCKNNDKTFNVETILQGKYSAKKLIIATGTYLGGRIFVGEGSYASGPDSCLPSVALSGCLAGLGLELRRFKTGTPARVHRRSIDFSLLQEQPGDDEPESFSFMTKEKLENKVKCHIAYTNAQTHAVILANIHRSPLYSGKIEGIGPRYCPSIEDKVVRFADKGQHQIFVEPCGLGTDEMYLQGMSSSLPEDVQMELYRTIAGFSRLELMRPAYAIEYDCINPLGLRPTLESKMIEGLYGAGQFNGTSGYEEAAAQGLVAGANAALAVLGREEFVLERQSSYIGTLIDDLVTKGVSDPYRMMTSRCEFRLYLRQDNADERLTQRGRQFGLVDEARWESFQREMAEKDAEEKRLSLAVVPPARANPLLQARGAAALKSGARAVDLLKRPELSYEDVAGILGNEPLLPARIGQRIETEVKYAGYIEKQKQLIQKVQRLEGKRIPEGFSYRQVSGLRLEAREKLEKIQPRSLAQASRIPGVSPNDIMQLALFLTK